MPACFKLAIEVRRLLRHTVLLDQREDGDLDQRQSRMQFHIDPRLQLALFVRLLVFGDTLRKEQRHRLRPAGSITCGMNRSRA